MLWKPYWKIPKVNVELDNVKEKTKITKLLKENYFQRAYV
jgi:hypothetical protein